MRSLQETVDLLNMIFHWHILDDERRSLLSALAACADGGFYLAGGTGLALQMGHRDSIDFDFFFDGDFDTDALATKIETQLTGHSCVFTQREKNTLSFVIDEKVQVSFLGYRYPLLRPLVETEFFPLAAIEDVACMKLAAVVGRSVEKDYVDLYFILQNMGLRELIERCAVKCPTLDANLVLKSLVYFDDVSREPILFKEGNEVSFEVVKKYLQQTVRDYFRVV